MAPRPTIARATVAIAAVLTVAVLGAGRTPLASAAGITQRHQDPVHKFSFVVYDDWAPVPLRPGSREVVAEYVQERAEEKGIQPAHLTVFRIHGAATSTSGSGSSAQAPPARKVRSGFDVLTERVAAHRMSPAPSEAANRPIKSRDDVPGRLWVHETRRIDQVQPRLIVREMFHLFASWKKPDGDVEYAMWMWCDPSQRGRFEPGFRQIAASFQWFDAKAKDVKTIDALSGVNLSPARRQAIERGLVKGWGVVVSPRKSYVVVYNTKGKRNDALARLIAERIELIREQVYEKQFPPARRIEDVAVVRVCGDRSEFIAYGGPRGSAGYWSDRSEELVFYDSSPATKVDDDTIAVLYHEAFHQYVWYSAGKVAPHAWFNEGHGDYYAGAKLVNGKFTMEPFSWRVGTIKNALTSGPSPKDPKTGEFDRRRQGYTPLRDLTRFSQEQYYAYPHVSYAQGWSLVWFLREIVPRNPAWNAKWGRILDTYFTTLRGTMAPEAAKAPSTGPLEAPPAAPDAKPPADDASPEDARGFVAPPSYPGGGDLDKALEAAFQGVDWKELEAAWKTSIQAVGG